MNDASAAATLLPAIALDIAVHWSGELPILPVNHLSRLVNPRAASQVMALVAAEVGAALFWTAEVVAQAA